MQGINMSPNGWYNVKSVPECGLVWSGHRSDAEQRLAPFMMSACGNNRSFWHMCLLCHKMGIWILRWVFDGTGSSYDIFRHDQTLELICQKSYSKLRENNFYFLVLLCSCGGERTGIQKYKSNLIIVLVNYAQKGLSFLVGTKLHLLHFKLGK